MFVADCTMKTRTLILLQEPAKNSVALRIYHRFLKNAKEEFKAEMLRMEQRADGLQVKAQHVSKELGRAERELELSQGEPIPSKIKTRIEN